MTTLLEAVKLGYNYPDGHCALKDVNLSLAEGRKIAVIGANGSGKSTLLLTLVGSLIPQTGQIIIENGSETATQERLREMVGLVFQEPDDQLFMPSVLEDVAFGLVARGMEQNEARQRALRELARFEISHLAERPPHRLSGGEKRLVALCGVLVTEPRIIALDEPSSSLDPRARKKLIATLKSLDQAMIVATHDLDMALDICDTTLILNDGSDIALGKIAELLADEELLTQNGLELPIGSKPRGAAPNFLPAAGDLSPDPGL